MAESPLPVWEETSFFAAPSAARQRMKFCLYLAKNKTEVAKQMVTHNIPHRFRGTKPIHTDCVADPDS